MLFDAFWAVRIPRVTRSTKSVLPHFPLRVLLAAPISPIQPLLDGLPGPSRLSPHKGCSDQQRKPSLDMDSDSAPLGVEQGLAQALWRKTVGMTMTRNAHSLSLSDTNSLMNSNMSYKRRNVERKRAHRPPSRLRLESSRSSPEVYKDRMRFIETWQILGCAVIFGSMCMVGQLRIERERQKRHRLECVLVFEKSGERNAAVHACMNFRKPCPSHDN